MLKRVTLKNIKFHQGMEGTGLNADIYIDSKKVAHVLDEAYGGCFNYQLHGGLDEKESGSYEDSPERKRHKKLFKEFEDYIETLPRRPLNIKDKDGKEMTYKPDMDTVIDDIINELENKKMEKKMKKNMEKAIVFGKRNGKGYRMIGYKKPLLQIVRNPLGLVAVEDLIKKIKNEKLKEGEEILNDNLEELGIEA